MSPSCEGEMVKLTVRILLLLAVLGLCRIVFDGFLNPDEPKEVLVVLVPGAHCAVSTVAPEDAGGN